MRSGEQDSKGVGSGSFSRGVPRRACSRSTMLRHATVSAPEEARERMTAYLDEMTTRLAFCLAVERDRELQRAMRRIADCGEGTPLYVMPSPSRAWLILEENRPVRLVDVPDGVRRLAMSELEAGHDLWREVFAATARVGADERAWKM